MFMKITKEIACINKRKCIILYYLSSFLKFKIQIQ